MKRMVLSCCLLLASTASAVEVTVPVLFPNNVEGERGGRGLLTTEGPSGMFLNPTSGTLAQGQVTAQYCLAGLEIGGDRVVAHGALASIGVTDWLEIGAIGQMISPDGHDFAAGGPQVRMRALADRGVWPELSIGAYVREGHEVATTRSGFVALSKRVDFDGDGHVPALRLHGGFRQTWMEVSGGPDPRGSIGYGGLEVELPKHLFVISEVSNRSSLYKRTPYSVGMQMRHPDGYGFSVSAVQLGFLDRVGVFVGIGVNFL